MMDKWKGSRSDRCMVFKMIPLLQLNEAKMLKLKHQFSEIFSLQLKKWCWRNRSLEQKGCQNKKDQHNSSPSMSMIRKQSCHSHKRTLWWKNLYQIIKVKEEIKEESDDFFSHKESIKRMLITWEWATNKYIYLTLLRSCGVLSGGNLKTEGKMNFIL